MNLIVIGLAVAFGYWLGKKYNVVASKDVPLKVERVAEKPSKGKKTGFVKYGKKK